MKPSSLLKGAIFILFLGSCLTGTQGLVSAQPIALVGGTVISDPESPPIENAVLLFENGYIMAVGGRSEIQIPEGAETRDITGQTILSGFWNAHVHFTEPVWQEAASQSADELSGALQDMLLRWGFVRVADTGSFLENTLALRDRISSGEVTGPVILTAGMPYAPPDGNPFYVEPLQAPQLTSVSQARTEVDRHFASGADLLKVFSGSPVAPGRTVLMPVEVLSEASEVAHSAGGLVVAHPTTNDGIVQAVAGGVDILAHTTPDGGQPWSENLVLDMKAAGLSVTPTLTLWSWSLEQQGASDEDIANMLSLAQGQVHAYSMAGGSILFGTDVGFMSEYNPQREYQLMAGSGLTFSQILRSLTTEPSRRFGVSETGVLSPGQSADLVVVNGRPDLSLDALTDVTVVYLKGEKVYEIP